MSLWDIARRTRFADSSATIVADVHANWFISGLLREIFIKRNERNGKTWELGAAQQKADNRKNKENKKRGE
ncbi:hypothetical protein COT30_02615 [Candidatus Micrarchaeota archaeon CG08_land_8_20_14_0_20_49_17]|nr:MAG: hypothetical protein AUJ13_01720 [Candidatus Micrarchaeota archaeon CG1_02_49_24]PIU09801.1 MAG: hypothetical protein COT30_02615 [Candidatus Micrarchaeota archaeon CG08_land_8_20_14_0_20_49_17]PIZ99526.1 MAG: hypothetical protein COX84_00870 [Candidatus Micrarchaeota archaeon CG_4_10_14_0_2_um_filter_49_7]